MKKVKQWIQYLGQQNVPLYASNASFFMILAIFPSLVILLALMRYTGLQIETFTELMEEVVPASLMPMVNRLVRSAYVNSSGTLLSVSAIAALWSSSRGMYSFIVGLNAINQLKEDRGYLRTRLLSVAYMFAFLIVLILTLVLHVFGKDLLMWLNGLLIPEFLLNLLDVRIFVLLILQTLLFSAMYTVLPNEHTRWRSNLPGALMAAIGWQLFTNIYSAYSQSYTEYANIYGSVYAIALGMLWLYFCICIVFYGGVLNEYLEKRK